MAVAVDGVRQPLTRRRERGVLVGAAGRARRPGRRRAPGRRGLGRRGTGARRSASLQVAVSRLRSQLEPDRAARKGSRLVSTAAGYALVAERRGRRRLGVRGPWPRRRWRPTTRQRAAARWRRGAARSGPATPYADCDVAARAEPRPSRLDELRLTVAGAAGPRPARPGPARGGAARAAPSWRRQHPYRERLWSLLALAQYQCARQADALETLRRLRERLADELGVDPSAEIQRLEQAVLRQDPALAAATAEQPRAAPPRPHRGGAVAPADAARDRDRRAASPCSTWRPRCSSAARDAASRGSCSSRASRASGSPGWCTTSASWPRGRASGCSSVAATKATTRRRCGRGWARPCAGRRPTDGRRSTRCWRRSSTVSALRGRGCRHRAADVRRRRRAGRATAAATQPLVAGARGHPLGRRVVAAAAPPPRRVRARRPPVAVVCTRRTTEATTGDGPGGRDGRPGPRGAERVRLDGLDAASVGALLHGRGRAPTTRARRRRRRGDRRQPVLRPPVRPAARRPPRTSARRSGRAAGARRRPRRAARAHPAAARGGARAARRAAVLGRRIDPDTRGRAGRHAGRRVPRPARPGAACGLRRGAGRRLRLRARAGPRDDLRPS